MLRRYMRWLHTGWPAGTVEKLPEVASDGTTALPGVRVVGDLTGIPLLKFSADTGAKAVHAIVGELGGDRASSEDCDLVIVGAGVAGVSAAIEAEKAGLNYVLYEASQVFSTVVNFPKGKPIFTYPTEMTPAGDLQFTADIKEDLVAELERQRQAHGVEPVHARVERIIRKGRALLVYVAGETEPVRARRVIIAIGRSGNFRKLGVPGEDLDKVYNRLHDPQEFTGKRVLVVGGGDSALETAIATARAGANVTLSYRKAEFARPKPDNIDAINQLLADPAADVGVEEPSSERVTTAYTANIRGAGAGSGSIRLALATQVAAIRAGEVDIKDAGGAVTTLPNDVVFSMIGREPPLDFFRRSGIPIRGEWRAKQYLGFFSFLAFCLLLYHWKSATPFPFTHFSVNEWFQRHGWFPFGVADWWDRITATAQVPTSFRYTLKTSMASPSFYYTLAYCLCVVIFGIRRIKRRRTPYVKLQTLTLMAIQCIPLFILPELVLPWLGRNGWFEQGTTLGAAADQFFEPYDIPSTEQLAEAGVSNIADWPTPMGRERAYWRAYGFVLAWPLFVWNFFTDQPMWGWLIVGSLQTFVLIPLMIRRWGKGAYCGWICSCGALAETLGDAHRHKMLHGPKWNRVNMIGQVFLAFALVLMLLRILSWIMPGSPFGGIYLALLKKLPVINYKWLVDLMFAGVIGVACYFWFSGRVWCRFACPLAALMHIYARFTRFRIFANKKKCISCNVCTAVCHQGIDVMNFANKGRSMEDPECVRCSACVQSCPTGVLTFGRLTVNSQPIYDKLAASPVQMAERRDGIHV